MAHDTPPRRIIDLDEAELSELVGAVVEERLTPLRADALAAVAQCRQARTARAGQTAGAVMSRVPPYLGPGEIARACGISRRRAFTELKNAHLLERRGPRWRISSTALRERLPEYCAACSRVAVR